MSRSGDAYRIDGQDLIVGLRVTPGARSEGFDGIAEGADGARFVRLKVRAKAQEGEANAAAIAMLAVALGVARSTISLESGRAARIKSLRIAGGASSAGRLKELLAQ